MGASMKQIKTRIKSVESTRQITKAMELVASSKLRKARDKAVVSQPYFEIMYETMMKIAENNKDFSSIYTKIPLNNLKLPKIYPEIPSGFKIVLYICKRKQASSTTGIEIAVRRLTVFSTKALLDVNGTLQNTLASVWVANIRLSSRLSNKNVRKLIKFK